MRGTEGRVSGMRAVEVALKMECKQQPTNHAELGSTHSRAVASRHQSRAGWVLLGLPQAYAALHATGSWLVRLHLAESTS